MIEAGVSLLSLIAASVVDVRAPGQCPSAADVARRLQPILPRAPAGTEPPADIAAVEERADGTLGLSLSLASGGLVGRRELPRAASCADQADAVAVTLAVWEAALHPDLTLALDRLPPDTSRAGPPRPAAVETRAARAPPAHAAGRLRLGAAFGFTHARGARDAFAPEAQIDGAWSLAGDTWRLRLSARGTDEQVLDVPPGEARFQRFALAAAVDRVVALSSSGDWKLSFGAGPVASAVRLRGAGFAVDRREVLPDVGGAATVRLERRLARWTVWLAVTLTGWLRAQRLEVIGLEPASPAELPRGEAAGVLGLSFSAL